MADPVFMDTSFALAGLDHDDQWHPAAMSLKEAVATASELVTTSAVLIEVCDALSAPRWRAGALMFVRSVLNDAKARVVDLSPTLFRSALGLFERRPDKHWSLTDCISFVVMDERKIVRALTADHHFEQAGFVALMRT